MWYRSMARGFMFGLGFALARALWGPILTLGLAVAGWSWIWAQAHHVSYMGGLDHTLTIGVAWLYRAVGWLGRIHAPAALHHLNSAISNRMAH